MRDGELVAAVVQGGRIWVRRFACQASSWSEMTASGLSPGIAIGGVRPDVVIFRRGDVAAGELARRLSEGARPRAAVLSVEAESDVLAEPAFDGASLIRELVSRCSDEPEVAHTPEPDSRDLSPEPAAASAPVVSPPVAEVQPAEEPTPVGESETAPPQEEVAAATGETDSPAATVAAVAEGHAMTSAAMRAARLARLLPIPLLGGSSNEGAESSIKR
ncbi:MAG: hypothetical protein ACE149_10855 [Armatimonadota bacterium]